MHHRMTAKNWLRYCFTRPIVPKTSMRRRSATRTHSADDWRSLSIPFPVVRRWSTWTTRLTMLSRPAISKLSESIQNRDHMRCPGDRHFRARNSERPYPRNQDYFKNSRQAQTLEKSRISSSIHVVNIIRKASWALRLAEEHVERCTLGG